MNRNRWFIVIGLVMIILCEIGKYRIRRAHAHRVAVDSEWSGFFEEVHREYTNSHGTNLVIYMGDCYITNDLAFTNYIDMTNPCLGQELLRFFTNSPPVMPTNRPKTWTRI